MKKENFSYSFNTPKTAREVFDLLLDIRQWWSGVFEETIEGKSRNLNDEFSFKAGGGVHYSKQKLVDLVPDKTVVWQVTDSNLTFLSEPGEWKGTKIRFDLLETKDHTTVTFTHEGLVPQMECYSNCSAGWTAYLDKLKKALS